MNDLKRDFLKQLSIRADGLRRAMEAVRADSTEAHAKWGVFKYYAKVYNQIASAYAEATDDTSTTIYNLDRMRGHGDTVWPIQKGIFDAIYADVLMLDGILREYVVGEATSIAVVQDLLFANLRKVIFVKPEKETDVQNAVEALLVGRGHQKGVSYDRESGKIEFSGKEFIPDFVFHDMNLALEIKLIKQKTDVSKCVEEMSADVTAYKPRYSNVLFCIYDLGIIRDIHELQTGFEKIGGIRVCVVKH